MTDDVRGVPGSGRMGDRHPRWADDEPMVAGQRAEWHVAGLVIEVEIGRLSGTEVPVRVLIDPSNRLRRVHPRALIRIDEPG